MTITETRNTFWEKVLGVCGFLAPIIGFALIFLAISSYPEFSWINNALSDLGIVEGSTATLFNTGLLISGALFFIFAIGLFSYFKETTTGIIGALILVLASVALFAIGVFPEDIRPLHYIFSVMFFMLLPLSLLVTTLAFLSRRQMQMTLFTLLVAFAAAAPWLLYFAVQYVPGVAIPEIISGFAGSTWTVVLGGKMLKQASHSKTIPRNTYGS